MPNPHAKLGDYHATTTTTGVSLSQAQAYRQTHGLLGWFQIKSGFANLGPPITASLGNRSCNNLILYDKCKTTGARRNTILHDLEHESWEFQFVTRDAAVKLLKPRRPISKLKIQNSRLIRNSNIEFKNLSLGYYLLTFANEY